VYHAPFGAPVVPLVKTIATGSSGAGSSAGGTPPKASPRRSTIARVLARISSGVSHSVVASSGSSGFSASTVPRKSASCHAVAPSRHFAPDWRSTCPISVRR
jgi:hypothetical protein